MNCLAIRRGPAERPAPDWHQAFLAMLPKITACARVAFQFLPPEAREEAVQETIANAMSAYVRLVERNLTAVAFPSALARYAIAQIRVGRLVGAKLNSRDVLSPYAQRRRKFVVMRLDRFDDDEGQWQEAVVEDHRTSVPDQVAFRIDFPAWLGILTRRDRRIAVRLAVGRTTEEVAEQFSLTSGRISQKRQEFHASWQTFHGEAIAVSNEPGK